MPDIIYPKDFFDSAKDQEEENFCFVLMPFKQELRATYEKAIGPAVTESGVDCLRADDIYSPRPILVTVMEHIAKAKFVIADLTERNANVFYELGFAHLVKSNERVILVSQGTTDVPFDLQHLRFIPYTTSEEGFTKLKTELQKTITSLGLASVEALSEDEVPGRMLDQILATQPRPPTFNLLDPKSRWTSARIQFAGSVSGSVFRTAKGRLVARLLEWFEFEEIAEDSDEVRFPGGFLNRSPNEWVSLALEAGNEERIDAMVIAIALRISSVTYSLDLLTTTGDLVREIRSHGVTISSVTGGTITVLPVDDGLGAIELVAAENSTTVRFMAPDTRVAAAPPLQLLLEFLNKEIDDIDAYREFASL